MSKYFKDFMIFMSRHFEDLMSKYFADSVKGH